MPTMRDETDFAGKCINITQSIIDKAGYNGIDNPISNAIEVHVKDCVSVSVCLMDEVIRFRGWFNYTPKIYTVTSLEDWYRDYLDNGTANPITMVFFTRDYDDVVENFQPDLNDEDDMECVGQLMEHVWVGISAIHWS